MGPSGIKGKGSLNKIKVILWNYWWKPVVNIYCAGDKGAPGYMGIPGIGGIKVNIQ